MISDFKVTWYDDYDVPCISKVYAIDIARAQFLVVDSYGKFKWTDIKYCELEEDKND